MWHSVDMDSMCADRKASISVEHSPVRRRIIDLGVGSERFALDEVVVLTRAGFALLAQGAFSSV